MIIKEKSIIVYPEFHFSDFPPQIYFSKNEISNILKNIKNISRSDIIISGYIEKENDKLYSSCFIIDGETTFNIRKKYPYGKEKDVILAGDSSFKLIPLSIGNSYFFICNDITVELETKQLNDFLKDNFVENLFLISAMKKNFDKWIKKLKMKAEKLNVERIIFCDRFNGREILKTNE